MQTLEGTGETQLITRAEWNARPPKRWQSLNPTFGTTAHWEGPHMGSFPHTSCATKVRAIQNFHMDTRRWSDIAYTGVVCPHGFVYEGRWIGRRTGANGTNLGNGTAYALCYLGGQGDGYTSAGSRAMHDAMHHLRVHGDAGPHTNCHRDWKSTACPGNEICGRVKTGLYRRPPSGSTSPPDPDLPPSTEQVEPMLLVNFPDDDKLGSRAGRIYGIFGGKAFWVRSLDDAAAIGESTGSKVVGISTAQAEELVKVYWP